jgi:hypothetical protein
LRFRTFLATLLNFTAEGSRESPTPLDAPPSPDDVINGLRLVHGRMPLDQAEIRGHLGHRSVLDLRLALLRSPEFTAAYARIRDVGEIHPDVNRGRDTFVFIHLLKTGGTSLRTYLESQFPPDRVCPIHWNSLHQIPAAALAHFDYFSGHYDYSSVRLIPRDKVRIISLFREPRARLISWYRALRSHPASGEYATDRFISMANEMSAEEFFESELVRSIPETFNYYLMTFGFAPSWLGRGLPVLSPDEIRAGMDVAMSHIRSLTALGLTERYAQSVTLICHALGLPCPGDLRAMNVTDELHSTKPGNKAVDRIEQTARLNAALSGLCQYDDELYEFAVREFDSRWRQLADGRPISDRGAADIAPPSTGS